VQRRCAKGDDRDIAARDLIGLQRVDRRHPVKDPIVLQEDGIQRVDEREVAQVAVVKAVNRRDPAFDILPVDKHDEHPVDTVAMQPIGRRLADLSEAAFDPELMQLHAAQRYLEEPRSAMHNPKAMLIICASDVR
jgi:hypothetical protein